ncbi:DUF1206 domain-containing protein [Rhodococcus maanshanensis]|uniref:DUF1206 domain-containing protein n=1 Tax=Rhodococcus maanshanensis TaxID=183556 RepID=UPI0022B2DB49|nr:DUF1206 domain-containing protein [Rhodococcus maanshanensis]MCZ4554376.1 DUF1206 domain-containing protein [Rhodococcus maanshanensis]
MSDSVTDSAAERVAQNSVFERFARAGYVTSGLVHLIIGYIAIRLALGGGGAADQSGALAELASKPGGVLALWVATVAFAAMALWRLAETIFGRSTDPKDQDPMSEVFDRGKALALAVVYLAFAYSTLEFTRGRGKSTGQQDAGISAHMMQSAAGTVALVTAGLVIVAVGGYHVYKGASQNFLEDLHGAPSNVVRTLGIAGYVAKGLVLAEVGVLVVVAAIVSDPNRATGLDGALKSLLSQPFGPVLVVVAGLGLITYGLYSFAMARYTKM